MKFIHLSDLHIGKKVNEFSMLEDQIYILEKILDIIAEERPDGVFIAGDVYDKSIPPAEAVQIFDDFLYKLSEMELKIFIISGNHDSPERISFGGRMMEGSGIYISPVYNGKTAPITLTDEYGTINIYMLPFIKPVHVRRYFPDEEIGSYTDAVQIAVNKMEIDETERNIILTHQFVTGAETSESEEISVGGSDNVDGSVFEKFDYVALGHIHRPQKVGSEKIRYCGTPLKYSFSEAGHNKSVTVLEIKEKGDLKIWECPLVPLRDMREIKGMYDEITFKGFYEGTGLQEDYVHITLTDEEDITDAIGKLRIIYKGLMKLDYDNKRTRASGEINVDNFLEKKTPFELFNDFYLFQNDSPLSDEQSELVTKMIEEIWEEEK